MATYTSNLNLKKPAGSENVSIGDINNNMDTIDTAYGTLNSQLTHRRQAGEYNDQIVYGAYGYITTSGTKAVVYIPFVWNITVQSANVTKFLSRIRTIHGTYLGGSNSADLTNNITSTSISKAQGLLVVTLDNSSGWGIDNNTPFIGEVTISYTVSNS